MSEKPNLLAKDNLVRHLSKKLEQLNQIKSVCSTLQEPLLIESLLATTISYLDAALLDTAREYVYANPDNIINDMLGKLDKYKLDSNRISELGFENFLLDEFLDIVANLDMHGKIKKLKKLTEIEVELGNVRWEKIREAVARRNCFIHNDLISNNNYFSQAGRMAEDVEQGTRLIVTIDYLTSIVQDIESLIEEIRHNLLEQYADRTNVIAVKGLWDYLFENHYPLIFEECWDTSSGTIWYKGPNLAEMMESSSPRVICLYSAWMSFFGYSTNGELKFFSDIFYNSAEGRKTYSAKLKYLMDAFEKIDFQTFGVQVYDKRIEQ